jgi:hypothetical protein
MSQLSLPSFLTSVIDWLREGYPNGIPEQDYVPFARTASSPADR